MKTDMTGGPAADGNLEERLSRHFTTELERAERDYPTLGRRRVDSPERRRPHGLTWPRLAVPVLAVAVLATAGLVGFGLMARPGDTTTGPGGPAAALGADGIPNQIDGERVYRVGETVESQKQGGYLLGGYVFQETANCPTDNVPAMRCFGLGPTAGSDATTGGIDVSVAIDVSDPYPPALGGWLGAPIVASMKGCTSFVDPIPTACPPVMMAIVWPTVPTEIAGERVYRSTDQAAFAAIKGSFLLGGLVTMPVVIPPCPAPIDHTTAENDLIPYCAWEAIDGIHLAPKVDALADLRNLFVVARVHVNDSEAASCPAAVLADCQAAIVVESVVWHSDGPMTANPSPYATTLVLNPASAGASAGTPSKSAGPSTPAVPSGSAGPMSPPPLPSSRPLQSGGAPAPGSVPTAIGS